VSIEASRYLDVAMNAAMFDATHSGWSEEGQITYIRKRMNAAYELVRRGDFLAR